jgi:hypothetical protein
MVSYDKWMQETKLSWSKVRSSRLKAIDKALKLRNESPASIANANRLRTAINDWCRWKGPNTWRTSKRNKGGVVEILRVQAFAPGLPTAMTMDEAAAFKFVLESAQQVLKTHFTGKRVTLKIKDAVSTGKEVEAQVKDSYAKFKTALKGVRDGEWPAGAAKPSLSRATGAAGGARTAASDFVKNDLLSLNPLDLAKAAKLIPTEQIVADLVPIVSLFTGAGKAAWGWVTVAKKAHAKYKMEDRSYAIERGDPKHAFKALTREMSRDTKSSAIKASLETASFTAKTAGTFLDGGTATATIATAVKAAGDLAHKLFLLGREIKEASAANELLRSPANLDFRLFEAFPLLGCYMIRCATLSDILAMSTVQFGSSGWMDDVEHMKSKYIDPMRKKCDQFIKASLFEIKGMSMMMQG